MIYVIEVVESEEITKAILSQMYNYRISCKICKSTMLPKEALVSLYYYAYTIQIETFDLRLGTHIKRHNDNTILFAQLMVFNMFQRDLYSCK